MADDELIVVFAKPAVSGAVKTRLLTILTPEQAAEFHLAALSDVVTAARRTSRLVELHVAGGEASRADLAARYPGVAVHSQSTGDLGARLAGALEAAFGRGFSRALIVGSDWALHLLRAYIVNLAVPIGKCLLARWRLGGDKAARPTTVGRESLILVGLDISIHARYGAGT